MKKSGEIMKIRKQRKRLPPLSHSNLSEEENLKSLYDPNGSYTGAPTQCDTPVQDADDL